MSYPGAPGANSLPPRPPVPKTGGGGFKSTFSSSPSTTPAPPGTTSSSYAAPGTSYAAAAPPVPAPSYGTGSYLSSYSQPPPPPLIAGRGAYGAAATTYSNYPSNYSQAASYYSAPATTGSYSTPPQIRNPFPQPAAAAPAQPANAFDRADPSYDADMAAQIAQWQSAYLPKEGAEATQTAVGPKMPDGKAGATSGPTFTAEAAAKAAQEGAVNAANERKKTVYREGGGKKWADDSLLEWDPSHLRLFVGNLAGETTDDSLLKAFSRWQSVQKAKVVRDKRTNKSKGYGFVSFSDPDEFFQAAKEMNGKYIQSHPVVVRKSTTEIKPAGVRDDRHKGKNFKKKGGKNNGSGAGNSDGGYSPHLGASGGGIVKPGQKTKSGLKLLG